MAFDYTQVDQAVEAIEAYDIPIGSRDDVLAELNAINAGVDETSVRANILGCAVMTNMSLAALVGVCKKADARADTGRAPGAIVDAVIEVRDILKRGLALTEALLPRLEQGDAAQPAPKVDA